MSADLSYLADPLPIEPLSGPMSGTAHIPGSKSITNRALVCAALADGTSTLDGVLFADDTEAMIDCLIRLGATIELDPVSARAQVSGVGGRLLPGPLELDARLSGTTSRFLMAVLGIGPGPYVLDGDEPLRRRPMGDGIHILRVLDVGVEELDVAGHLPVRVSGSPGNGGGIAVPGSAS